VFLVTKDILLGFTVLLGGAMSPQGDQDLKLIAACIKGDKTAWDLFVDKYSGAIYHAINRVLKRTFNSMDEELSLDLFQTVFAHLLDNNKKKLKSFRGNSKLSTWLYAVTTNIVKDYLCSKEFKSRSYQISLNSTHMSNSSIEDRLVANNPQPYKKLEDMEMRNMINIMKKQLSKREQLFFSLSYGKELSFADIAQIMKTTTNNIYQIKSRVVEKLTVLIDDFYKKSETISSN